MLPEERRGIFGLRPAERSASWLRPSVLWRSRNDILARIGDPTDETRRAWMEHIGADPARDDLTIDLTDIDRPALLTIGDTGEGDASQYAVVPALRARSEGTDAMVVLSDVIYPAGEVNDYVSKFHYPYSFYPGPIHAVPGNHDWYDGLNGFMVNFCVTEPLPQGPIPDHGWLHRLLWRRPSVADPLAQAIGQALRPRPEQQSRQPGPYFTIETGPLRFVAIDTGIRGRLDADQGAWLRRVSASSSKPKVLLTGKPLVVDGERKRCDIEGGGEVDEIVRDPAHNYVAAIGGDIHNYQRYPVKLGDGRTIQYVVTGGGGAFMHATHKIGRVKEEETGVDEAGFRCYPLRGDSLSFYSHLLRKKLLFRWLPAIPPAEAAEIMARKLGGTPTRVQNAEAAGGDPERVKVRWRSRISAFVVMRAPGPKFLQRFFSEIFDWNEPPMFKSFVRLEVTDAGLELTCNAATGCLEDEHDPPIEDRLTIPLPAAGADRIETAAIADAETAATADG
jgi:hypothetical protein